MMHSAASIAFVFLCLFLYFPYCELFTVTIVTCLRLSCHLRLLATDGLLKWTLRAVWQLSVVPDGAIVSCVVAPNQHIANELADV